MKILCSNLRLSLLICNPFAHSLQCPFGWNVKKFSLKIIPFNNINKSSVFQLFKHYTRSASHLHTAFWLPFLRAFSIFSIFFLSFLLIHWQRNMFLELNLHAFIPISLPCEYRSVWKKKILESKFQATLYFFFRRPLFGNGH